VGRGKSEWLSDKSQYDYETYVSDVIKLLDHLGIRKFDWVGTSMGGIIGMIIASKYPHIVRSLVLNDIGPIIPGKAIERILSYVGASYEFNNKIDAERSLRERMVTFGIQKEEHWKHLMTHSIIKKLNGKYTFTYDPDIIPTQKLINKLTGMMRKIMPGEKKSDFPDVNLLDIWTKITCPILALRGKQSDVLTKAVAIEMKNSKENIKIVEFDNIGHAPMLMEDEQIEIVRKWLLKKK
jgi:pimeloyl-ACP methyl ester carboxylesterase